ncbi:MAG TPA: 3-hydroxyacyl-CoA dehydrogenase NAD-binding domain-containing protein [Vicinamibacterales bacterium]|nr:3-hydroxyacyl-CoA dehydrogenase NAD-binding domain-containing protein [Vicinamibacterales bacterium]
MIRSVAVLGAGVMGAQIAAHFANAGVPSLLLDLTSEAAAQGLQRARTLKPDPFFTPDTWKLITTGSFDDGLSRLREADWILEAVVERLDVKRALLEKVDAARRPGAIVSSNTSGIPIAALAEGRSDDFRRHWLGTHFFNPPRYLRLLEIIPTPETQQPVIDTVTRFADHRLGKGVVIAKDSPNFIGNHIGLYGVTQLLAKVAAGEFTIEEIDAVTGPAIGRPGSATFRTLDLAGVDILSHVIENLHERLDDAHARAVFALPPFVKQMVERGMSGEKAGHGFYKRVKNAAGESEILTLDPTTLDYRPRQTPKLTSVEAGKSIADVGERIRTLFNARDKAGQLLRDTLAPALVYTANVTPAIAHSPDDVDRVMRWGFGWELGPFEIADAIGIQQVLDAAEVAAPDVAKSGVPEIWQETLAGGWNRLRHGDVAPAAPDLQILRSARERSAVVRKNAGASLLDLGDGVLAVEFHSKMNAIGGDTIQMLQEGVREASKNFAALVVGNDATHFSAGANLMLVLLEAQEENWDEIDLMVRAFQQSTMALRYADVPVVVAPAGLALGGGCEIILHADRVQAAAETYMGLVEVGVGLIPAGGGTKEMVVRAAEARTGSDLLPVVQRAFETIAFAKTSTSAPDAHRLGYLRPTDAYTMNRERLLSDAKTRALQRVREGYQPPVPGSAIPVGGDTVAAPLKLGVHLAHRAGRISDHDALIGRKLATIMAGGSLPHATTVTEQHLLDLEREAFLSLVAERKTQERIAHTLKTGKPLRN